MRVSASGKQGHQREGYGAAHGNILYGEGGVLMSAEYSKTEFERYWLKFDRS